MGYVNVKNIKYSHTAPRRHVQLQYFLTPLRSISRRYNILHLRSTALRTTLVLSHPVTRRFAPLQYFHNPTRRFATLQYYSTRSTIFQHRSIALFSAPILSYFPPRYFAPLQDFPTTLLGASRLSNITSRVAEYPSDRFAAEKYLRVYRTPYTR